MPTSPLTHLLWVDLETTGLDLVLDGIVEIGAILTDTDLNVIDELGLLVTPTTAQRHRLDGDEFVSAMHRGNGLLEALDRYPYPNIVDVLTTGALLDWLTGHGVTKGRVAICGSGVAKFDYQFLARDLPELTDFCAYYVPTDTGVLRRSYQLATGELLSDVNESKTHRGIDDVRCHLAEAQAFRRAFQFLAQAVAHDPELLA